MEQKERTKDRPKERHNGRTTDGAHERKTGREKKGTHTEDRKNKRQTHTR